MRVAFAALCAAGMMTLAGHAAAATMFSIIELPGASNPLHINDAGQFASVGLNNLGNTAGFDVTGPAASFTWHDINESNVSIGTAPADGPSPIHAVQWSAGTLTDLGLLPGATASAALGINDSGLVVGDTVPGSEPEEVAVYWDATGPHRLPRLNDTFDKFNVTSAVDVNSSGLIAGLSTVDDSHEHAVLWSGGVIQDLGTLYGGSSVAAALNDAGEVVGLSLSGGDHAGFLWDGSQLLDLNALTGGLTPDERITNALDINNNGQILVQIMNADGGRIALLDPIGAGGVPEPATWAMLLLGFIGIGTAARRQRDLALS